MIEKTFRYLSGDGKRWTGNDGRETMDGKQCSLTDERKTGNGKKILAGSYKI
ncbi:hypothetical protein [Flavobacterium granuli]|uniref:hypothetical protein n=1 Tax=Flavobacterium granuli TaxID=280093 RepID=UPI001473E258|nr:hypothetical protein [Flavobacterium granuli]